MNDFCFEKQTSFKINDVEYVMYNHILETMEIFNVLKDCGNDYVKIKWDISPETVNMLFHVINDKNYALINPDDHLAHHLEIIRFVEYLGLEKNILQEIVDNMFDEFIIDYIDRCLEIDYDDNMMLVVDFFDEWYYLVDEDCNIAEVFKKFIDKITSSHFPIKFRAKVIKEMVSKNAPKYTGAKKITKDMIDMIVNTSCDLFDCQNDEDTIRKKVCHEIGYKNDYLPDMEKIIEFLVNCIVESLLSRDVTESIKRGKSQSSITNYCNINEFCTEKQTRFKINNIEYALYNHIIKEMTIFDTLQNDEMFEIQWDISLERINLAFHIINDKNFELVAHDGYQFEHLDILKFMKYMGARQDVIDETVHYMISDDLIEYIHMCKTIKYDDEMLYIFDRKPLLLFSVSNMRLFRILIDEVTSPHFSMEFQKKVIYKAIVRNMYFPYVKLKKDTIAIEIDGKCEQFGYGINIIETKRKIHEQIINQIAPETDYSDCTKEIIEIMANILTVALLSRNK